MQMQYNNIVLLVLCYHYFDYSLLYSLYYIIIIIAYHIIIIYSYIIICTITVSAEFCNYCICVVYFVVL